MTHRLVDVAVPWALPILPFRLTPAQVDATLVDMALTKRVVIDPKVMLGKPVIKGTRITVELIVRKLGEGTTAEQLLGSYPPLSEEDIRAALTYAADVLAHEETIVLSSSGKS